MKYQVKRALCHFRNLRSPDGLRNYISLRKAYRQIIENKKNHFIDNEKIKLLNTAKQSNCKDFWAMVKNRTVGPSTNMELHDWFNFFSQLFVESDSQAMKAMIKRGVCEQNFCLMASRGGSYQYKLFPQTLQKITLFC